MLRFSRTVQADDELPALFVVLHVDLGVARVEGTGLRCLRHRAPATVRRSRCANPRGAALAEKWLHEMMSVKAKHFIQRNQL